MSGVSNRYAAIIEHIFLAAHRNNPKADRLDFERVEIERAAQTLGIVLPKNLGDVIYSIRFRTQLPQSVLDTEHGGRQWIIELAGRSRYRFRLAKLSSIEPSAHAAKIAIPDSTPELIAYYTLDDEQALLAKVRYNRLIDTFLGLTTYSLQNHLRSSAKGIGQIEIDELYVGTDKRGCQYLIPVQAKGGKDRISTVQAAQDAAWCAQRWPALRCRPIAAYFIDSDTLALFELKVDGEEVSVLEEKHYRLVDGDQVDQAQKIRYAPEQ